MPSGRRKSCANNSCVGMGGQLGCRGRTSYRQCAANRLLITIITSCAGGGSCGRCGPWPVPGSLQQVGDRLKLSDGPVHRGHPRNMAWLSTEADPRIRRECARTGCKPAAVSERDRNAGPPSSSLPNLWTWPALPLSCRKRAYQPVLGRRLALRAPYVLLVGVAGVSGGLTDVQSHHVLGVGLGNSAVLPGRGLGARLRPRGFGTPAGTSSALGGAGDSTPLCPARSPLARDEPAGR
jgi:hypothetical protein